MAKEDTTEPSASKSAKKKYCCIEKCYCNNQLFREGDTVEAPEDEIPAEHFREVN